MKKKTYVLPIILCFSLIYLFSICLSTYFMTEHYQEQFDYEYTNAIIDLKERFSNTPEYMLGEVENDTENYKNYMGLLISQMQNTVSSKDYQQYSIAIYDNSGNKLVQSGNYISFHAFDLSSYPEYTEKAFYYQLDDYIDYDQLEFLLPYYMVVSQREQAEDYYLYSCIEKETGELMSFYVSVTPEIDSLTVSAMDKVIDVRWQWESPEYQAHDYGYLYQTNEVLLADQNLVIPYLYNGREHYGTWLRDRFLQDHPEWREFEVGMGTNQTNSLFTVQQEVFGNFTFENMTASENLHWIVLRATSKPLLAAVDYLKYIYIIAFLVMLACVLKVLYSANKTYKEQLTLEETRRTFTDMVAKDMETPLDTIHKLAEDLQKGGGDSGQEEICKRIIEQTENIDEMVREMVQK